MEQHFHDVVAVKLIDDLFGALYVDGELSDFLLTDHEMLEEIADFSPMHFVLRKNIPSDSEYVSAYGWPHHLSELTKADNE